MTRRYIQNCVNRVHPESINMIITHPRASVIAKEAPHLVTAAAVEIYCASPRGFVSIGEIWSEARKVITRRTEVVVNNVKYCGQTFCVTRIHQPFKCGRTAVYVMRSEQIHAIVAPSSPAGELSHRHQLKVRNPELYQVIEAFDRGIEGPFRRKGTDMDLKENRVRERRRNKILVAPGKCLVIDDSRSSVHSIRLKLRAGIGQRLLVVID